MYQLRHNYTDCIRTAGSKINSKYVGFVVMFPSIRMYKVTGFLARRPAYDTAFLFLGDRFDDANVPPWAMKVVLDEEEFTGEAARSASALSEALAEEDDLYRDLNNS